LLCLKFDCFAQTKSSISVRDFDSLDFSSQGHDLKLFATFSSNENKLKSWFVSFINPITKKTDTLYLHMFYAPFSYFTYDYPKKSEEKVALQDYNLDGFLDLKIIGSYDGSYVLFIYNPLKNTYEADMKTVYSTHLEVNEHDSTLTTVKTPQCGLGGGFSDSTNYKIRSGKFFVNYYSNFKYIYTTNKPDKPFAKDAKLVTINSLEKYRLRNGQKEFMLRKKWKVKGHTFSPEKK